ncbi:MAG: ATP-dependent helicase HrpB [Acidobacteriota bacterium]
MPLPIDAFLPAIVENLRLAGRLVIQAAPGAGKTTRVPAALLEAGLSGRDDIVVVVPRRLAARLAARFVARSYGEAVGQTVGYTIRFDDRTGAATRLRFVTDGIFTRRLLRDPTLRGTGIVVVDEFHERHLSTDLALAHLHRLRQGARPDLQVVVMSATLAAGQVAAFLGGAPVVTVPGQTFPVAVEYLPASLADALPQQVAAALERCLRDGLDGHVLVFLPGIVEIRACLQACAPLAARHDLSLHALHASLSSAEQDAAVQPGPRRKVILATNIAESAITIEGVTVVIDSGLVRRVEHTSWTGLPRATIGRVSQAAAIQRAGRAGRTCPGRCLRLYTETDFNLRLPFETPEIHRTDLAETVLELRAAGIHDAQAFAWFEPPKAEALSAAEDTLHRLGALDATGLTAIGRAMLELPLAPRLARLVVEGHRRGVVQEACRVAAMLSERDVRREATVPSGYGQSDVLALLDTFETANEARTVARVRQVEQQLLRLVRRLPPFHLPLPAGEMAGDVESRLGRCLLVAFPDRVGRIRWRPTGEREVMLPGGGRARLASSSVVTEPGLVLALDAETQMDGTTLVRLASHIPPDWLLELFFDAIEETDTHELNPEGRVVRCRRLLYQGIVFDEQVLSAVEPVAASRLLIDHLRTTGGMSVLAEPALDRLQARLAFAAAYVPEAGLRPFTDDEVWAAVEACHLGCVTLEAVRQALQKQHLSALLLARLTPTQRARLDEIAPEALLLGRRRLVIRYPADGPPCIAAPIQDFFGVTETPRLASGRVPVTLHLLAPNRRPVQVTTDLSGFWKRTYRELRPQLARRYPKHAFPEVDADGRPCSR